MKKLLFLLLVFILPIFCFGDDLNGDGKLIDKATDTFNDTIDAIGRVASSKKTSSDLRSEKPFAFGVRYSGIDLWVPNKLGAHLNYRLSSHNELELSGSYASYNIGDGLFELSDIKAFAKVSELELVIGNRWYGSSNSFNILYGGFFRQFKTEIDLDSVEEAISVATSGLNLAISNRWSFNSFTFGIDWIGASIPIFVSKKEGLDDGESLETLLTRVPFVSFLKFDLSYTF